VYRYEIARQRTVADMLKNNPSCKSLCVRPTFDHMTARGEARSSKCEFATHTI
jgi:hypothetical protein